MSWCIFVLEVQRTILPTYFISCFPLYFVKGSVRLLLCLRVSLNFEYLSFFSLFFCCVLHCLLCVSISTVYIFFDSTVSIQCLFEKPGLNFQ